MDEKRSLHKANTPDELLARILDAADAQRYVKINSDEQHAIFAHGVQKRIEIDGGIFEHLL